MGTGASGERFRDDEHLYANDLDLFGHGSLFELLSIARTQSGEETIAAWLKAPAPPDIIRARQHAVDELGPRLDLREELALAGTEVRAGVDTVALVRWAAAPPILAARWPAALATLLTMATLMGAAVWVLRAAPQLFAAAVLSTIILSLPLRSRVSRVLHAAGAAARDLDILAHVLLRLERERFASEALVDLSATLRHEVPASSAISRLHRLAAMHDWQHNQFFAPVAAMLLWGTHLAYAMERWRRVHGAHVERWLTTVGEFEALSSFAAYRYEHPADVFPEIADTLPAVFEGSALGHPLLAASRMVRNDVRLVQLLIVSGSNMSGKSTLLRTVGVNTVLAFAGAPVRASRLRLTPMAVGATLRIQDSLQEGRSRFYAEITRIRRLTDVAAGPLPLLFLLDELFHGTNSHDRLAGASGVLRALLDRGAIGLVTTHDLALTQIADAFGARAANVHFDDAFDGGELRFDYVMKPGPVTRSNALALMRAVGLPVD